MPPAIVKVRDWSVVVLLAGTIVGSIGATAVAFHRLNAVEARAEAAQSDHDLLIRIDATVQSIDRRIQTLEGQRGRAAPAGRPADITTP